MKTVTGMWIVTLVTGLWLSLIQPAHAFDIRSCHLLHPGDLNLQVIVSHLPEAKQAQLKATFMTNSSGDRDHCSSDCLRLSGQAEIEAYYLGIAANSVDAVAWNNLGYKLFSLERYAEALVAYDHALRRMKLCLIS